MESAAWGCSKREVALVFGLALVATLGGLAVRHWLVPLGTHDADEAGYANLAALLRHGHVTMSASTYEPFFRPWLTGSRHGSLFFQYEPGWPAALAVGQALGWPTLVPALTAGALVVAVHALAWELLHDRRVALVAAGLTALTPIFWLHAALELAYLFTALLATITVTAALRAVRRSSRGCAVATGVLLGAVLLTRPLDALLTLIGVLTAVALVVERPVIVKSRRLVGWSVLGAAPLLALVLLFNRATTGSVTTFPLSASDPRNTFGFGPRAMQVGSNALDYTPHIALNALGTNLRGAINWLPGGLVAVGLAAWAVARGRNGPRWWLLGMVALYPMAYIFWWATAWSASAATNGIGPHYYIPAFVPFIVLTADGLTHLARRHALVAVAAIMIGACATDWSIPDKVHENRWVARGDRALDDAVPHDLHNAIVFISNDRPEDFTGLRYPFVRNEPGLHGPVLYPADRHARNAALLLAMPHRTGYLLHPEVNPGDNIFKPHWKLTPLEVTTGEEVDLSVQTHAPFDLPAGHRVVEVLRLDGRANRSSSSPLVEPTWNTTVKLVPADQPGCGSTRSWCLALTRGDHVVTIRMKDAATGEFWGRNYQVHVDEHALSAIRPGTGEHVTRLIGKIVHIPEDVNTVVSDRTGD
ncbi:MAG: hypothetical protein JO291_12075 [Acidimicrobiia bacterium]|nr:hypothetical protein [Acidimicrobiia bacterium]